MTMTYQQAMQGKFTGIMTWTDLDALWQRIRDSESPWYVYDTEGSPPEAPLAPEQLAQQLGVIDRELHTRHEHDYCGIVYADKPAQPSFIKVYDPDNLGVVCGYSDNPPLPRWVLSHMPPAQLEQIKPKPSGWRRWIPGAF
ncbi:MAG: hypothetical protein PVF52_02035 [Granulosicoccaceae bacterium]|jgi:hypothetical protein